MSGSVLYVDDDIEACTLASAMLRSHGFQVVTETSGRAAVELAIADEFDAVVTDLRLGALDGLAVCERVVAAKPNLPVVVVTGHATMKAAIGALRAGAYDFVAKPFDADLLLAAVRRATQSSRLREEVKLLRATVSTESTVGTMIGDSPPMRRVYQVVARVARTDASVLITGESGTGKELIAHQIHDLSARAKGPFVAINCAAVPASLLESELFGHIRGAFTDAKQSRRGLFLDAHGGTLFLDEVGEMPLEMQAKLLRALQERTVRPVGGTQEITFNARLICATARDLQAAVAAKSFRADFYYRINVCSVVVPPLREREGDIAVLTQRFITRFAERHERDVKGITSAALAKLVAYRWPGNVRELENCIERAVIMTRSELLLPADLPEQVCTYRPSAPASLLSETVAGLVTIEELENEYITHVLNLVGGNKSQAARVLGIDRRTLHRKIERDSNASAPVDPDREQSRPSRPPPAVTRSERPVVLIADEDRDGREMLALLLAAHGFEVREAPSLVEARGLLPGVACVVVSVSHVDEDARALATSGGPPALLLTADENEEMEDPFEEVLRKPVRAEDVASALRRLLSPGPVSA